MWPMLLMALASTKMQNDEQQKMYKRAMQQQLAGVQQDIAGRRAARAGDSGYMQSALAGMQGGPQKPANAGGPMLAQLGSALLSQPTEPKVQPSTGIKLTRDEFY